MKEDLNETLAVLKRGGVILYPTDTVWGLGCDATNVEAVARVYKIKQREDSKSMLVLMENPALLDRYVDDVPEIAWDLIEITTTPLTVIYLGAKNLAPNLIATDGSIGIRFTREEFTLELLKRFRRPIVSTSANISGQSTPVLFSEISDEIKSAVDYVVKFRQEDHERAKPSGIIKLGAGGKVEIIRE
jgi:L-threonylcarbamoyladenylate synthase